MDLTPVPLERRRRPLLYGALVTGTLAVVAAAGWVVLSPSPPLRRQVAAGTTQPTESMPRPASDAPVQPAKLNPPPAPESPRAECKVGCATGKRAFRFVASPTGRPAPRLSPTRKGASRPSQSSRAPP